MAYRDVILADGPSNYWRLNEPSGLVATDQIGGANGTISGGVTLAQPGALADGDTAMTFDGTTGNVITTALPIPVPSTLEVWAKLASVPPSFAAAASSRSGPNGYLLGSNGLSLICYSDNSTPVQVLAGVSLTVGQWYHLVLVRTATTVTFYVNGIAYGPFAQTHAPVSALFCISDVGWGNPWPGSLDEVAIYPVALTPAQIANHYASAFALSVPSGGADDDDEDDDDEARFRLQEFYGSIAGSVHVAASDSGLIPLVPARSKHTLFVQRLAPVVTTGGPASWTVQDGALPPVPLLTAPASAVAVLPVRDFGANGVPCTEGAPLLLALSAPGAAGWLTWEGYRKLTGVETLPSATSPHYRDLVIADGASNYWRLNEPSGLVAVDQIGGANGTISGGVTLNQPGALADGDKAMLFAAAGNIQLPVNAVVSGWKSWEGWIRTTVGVNAGTNYVIFDDRYDGLNGRLIRLNGDTGVLVLLAYSGGANVGAIIGSRAGLYDQQWHHLVVNNSGGTFEFFIDGVRDNFGPVAAAGAATIGARINGTAQSLIGLIDEVAIYPVALTPAQIAAHYAARANL